MTIKKRFAGEYGKNARVSPSAFKLDEIKAQAPDTYAVDKMVEIGDEDRCDYFVMCNCAPSTTGIYVVETKRKKWEVGKIAAQLKWGAGFLDEHLQETDKVDFLPVLVARALPRHAHPEFQKVRIRLKGGVERQAKYVKRGDSLPKIKT